MPSEELAHELQKHLQDRRFPSATYDKGRRALQYPENLTASEWSNIRAETEKWAKGRNMELSETLRLQLHQVPQAQPKAEPKFSDEELKKKVNALSPEEAEKRYLYLSGKPLSELSDAEYQERLELAQRTLEKPKPDKK